MRILLAAEKLEVHVLWPALTNRIIAFVAGVIQLESPTISRIDRRGRPAALGSASAGLGAVPNRSISALNRPS